MRKLILAALAGASLAALADDRPEPTYTWLPPDKPASWYEGDNWYNNSGAGFFDNGPSAEEWYTTDQAESAPPALSSATLYIPQGPVGGGKTYFQDAKTAEANGDTALAAAYRQCGVTHQRLSQAYSTVNYRQLSKSQADYTVAYANLMNIAMGDSQNFELPAPDDNAPATNPPALATAEIKAGAYLFRAETAKRSGQVEFSKAGGSTVYWMPGGELSWPETRVRPGAYGVYLYRRVSTSELGGQFELDVSGQKFHGVTAGGSGWETVEVAKATIKGDRATIKLRNLSSAGNLMWLKGLVMKPLK